ncbi:MAG TPA: trypsin-like peptidase domain-containing protein [Anaerolineae bacterium]|nr:trypsin-like peptidase domain-containing protein [Anaerolineae bacterium]HOR00239.1 trypsin-like peptidase domain-containing protein [Anaerolineae bacterium]HPL27763.1 trypsin-like peptidase domain-containing protein [Anaerolineae bacterium]
MKGKHCHLAAALVLALSLAAVSGCSSLLGNRAQVGGTTTPGGTGTPPATRATGTPTSRNSTPQSAPATAPASVVPVSRAIRDVVECVRPAVVQVTNQQHVNPELSQGAVLQTIGIGSGVIYDPSGLILTNDHVVIGAERLLVTLPDGRSFDGRLVGSDPQTDLAVLRVNQQGLPTAELGDAASLAVGDWVVAIGNALALTGGPTVTQGIVSALDRAIQAPPSSSSQTATPQAGSQGGRFLFNLIQTDAAINPGNSGGPLVNLQGQVVGINTLVAVSTPSGEPIEGIGFATSINTARAIADQLVATGRAVHPYLGIQYVPLSPALAARLNVSEQRGMYIQNVVANSPAAQAGLRQGDVIVSADGQTLDTESSLARVIESHKPGDTIALTVVRDGRRLTLQVTLGQQPS